MKGKLLNSEYSLSPFVLERDKDNNICLLKRCLEKEIKAVTRPLMHGTERGDRGGYGWR
jgi:hypothetical protein